MARTPKGNDRAQIMAVAAGEADIAVANTYYLALMLSCLLYTSPSPRDVEESRMPSSA